MLEAVELNPRDLIVLAALLDAFSPQTECRPQGCWPWCTLCRDLLIRREPS
jgi:hypothetical protein